MASCLRGALPPVDLRAVCLVRAMANKDHLRAHYKVCFGKVTTKHFEAHVQRKSLRVQDIKDKNVIFQLFTIVYNTIVF